MMMKRALLCVVLLASFLPRLGFADLIGDPAAPLVVSEWIKGRPVQVKPGTNIVVVEIWNVSSLVSRVAITNLNQLQKRFQNNGVVIVGISDEPADVIKQFVLHGAGTNIEYTIAADDHRQTSLGYMKPIGEQGIPYAFVVGTNGILLWHGHPLHGLDTALEEITTGKYDLARHAKLDLASHQMLQYLALAQRGDVRAREAGLVVLRGRTNDAPLLRDLAFQIATDPQIKRRDFALASMALDLAGKVDATNVARTMIVRAVLLFQTGQREEGIAQAKQALAAAKSVADKADVQENLKVMEARWALIKAHESNTDKINAKQSSSGPVSGPDTNQNNVGQANAVQDSAGKP